MGRWHLGKAIKGAGKAVQGGASIASNVVGKAVDVSSSTIKHAAETGSELRNVAADEMSAISRLGPKKIIDDVANVKRKVTHRSAGTTPSMQDVHPADSEQTNTTDSCTRGSKPNSTLLGSQTPHAITVQDEDIQQQEFQTAPVAIDRRTQFTEGLLTLTAEGLILYDADGQREIMRMPIDIISTCSRGLKKNSLVVRRMTNIKFNFQKYINKKKRELVTLTGKVDNLQWHTATSANVSTAFALKSIKDGKPDIMNAAIASAAGTKAIIAGAYTMKKSHDLKVLPSYLEHLELDIPTMVKTARKEADTEKKSFHLPDSYTPEEAAHEYLIWEYLINRRMSGRNLNITTTPTNAVVLVDEVVQGRTPLVVGLPLAERIALAGKCSISVLLEGHEHETMSISSSKKEYEYHNIQMKPRKIEDPVVDQLVNAHRAAAPCRPIDMSPYRVEYEVVGVHGVLAITQDRILMLTHDKTEYLYMIPYTSVNEAKIMKKFAQGVKGISVSYNDDDFASLKMEFVVEQAESRSETEGTLGQIVKTIMGRRGRVCTQTTEYHPPRDPIRNLRPDKMATES